MGKFFDSLTKAGVQDPDGTTAFYDTPSAAAVAVAKKTKAPAMVPVLPNSIPLVSDNSATAQPPLSYAQSVNPSGDLTPGGGAGDATPAPAVMKTTPKAAQPPTQFKEEEVANPKLVKPSFNDNNVDSAGNQKRLTPNSGLTKLGALFSVLTGGVQGVSDALAGGAMDAHNGPDRPSAFGVGLRAAEEMPLIRAARQREIAEQNAKLAQTEAQTQNLQGETQLHKAQIPYFLQRGAAYNALAQKRGNLSTQEQLDLATQDALDNGRDPNIDPNVLQLRTALKAENDAKAKGRSGQGGGAPHTVQANGRVLQYNPDSGRFDIDVGKAEKPSSADGAFGATLAQMRFDEQKAKNLSEIQNQAENQRATHDNQITKRLDDVSKAVDNGSLALGGDEWKKRMSQIERDDYKGKVSIGQNLENRAKGFGVTIPAPTPEPWTSSFLSDEERSQLLGGGSQSAPSKKPPVPALNTGKKSRPPLSSFDHSTGK